MLGACPNGAPMTSTEEPSETSAEPDSSSSSSVAATTTTGCEVGELGCPCTSGGGCNPGFECNDAHVCEAAPGTSDETSVDETTGTTTSTGSDTSTESTTSTDDETTAPLAECGTPGATVISQECTEVDALRPFCGEDSICRACVSDDECAAGTGGASPVCLDAGPMKGACGACDTVDAVANGQCSPQHPHCNLDTAECEGCFEHSECPSTACDVAARTCFPDDQRVYVRRGPTMASPCTWEVPTGGYPAKPYCDIASAIEHAQFNGVTSGWTFVLMGSDSPDNHGSFTVSAGDTEVSYAVKHSLGSPGDLHTYFKAYGPVITVEEKVTLYVVDMGVEMANNAFSDLHLGVQCEPGGHLWLDDTRVLKSVGPGIRAEGCDVHLRRSSVAFGKTEGIEIVGGSLHMVNSFIDANGSNSDFGGGALSMSGGATADILYSTMVNNKNVNLSKRGDTVDCAGPVDLKIRNSIFARGPGTGNASIVCDEGTVEVSNSVIDGEFLDAGNHKLSAEEIIMALTVDMVTGVYRINPLHIGVFEKRAVWQLGDPRSDYDRQPRNAVVDMGDFAGADIP